MVTAYLGLGSNLGDRQANLEKALELLGQRLKVEQVSSFYDTEPANNPAQPRFLNLVCRVSTGLAPTGLLSLAKGIESRLGRMPETHDRPRPIDIDVLLYGDEVTGLPDLVIPHPRLVERAFVLVPLAEIAPDVKHPANGKTAATLLAELRQGVQGVLKLESGSKGARTDV